MLDVHGGGHLSALDAVLITYLPTRSERILFPFPCAGTTLPEIAAACVSKARIDVFGLDMFDHARNQERTAYAENVVCTLGTDIQADEHGTQAALVSVERDTDRLLVIDTLERLVHILPDRSPLLVAMVSRRTKDLLPRLKKLTTQGTLVEKTGKAAVFRGLTRGDRRDKWTPRIATFEAQTPTESVTITTRPGVFAHGRPDAGGIALAESAIVQPGDRVLDLGCGAGMVGLLLAARMRAACPGAPPGDVLLVDSNIRAIERAEANIERNSFPFVHTQLTHDYAAQADSFDVVVANPALARAVTAIH